MRIAWRMRGAHDGLAHATDDATHHAAGGRDVVRVEPHDTTREHQAPGRGIHEQRLAVTEVAGPVAAAQLVGDQPVGGLVIGDAQQGLGEAHQDHALLRREVVLAQEGVQAGLGRGRLAHCLDELAGGRLHFGVLRVVEAGAVRK